MCIFLQVNTLAYAKAAPGRAAFAYMSTKYPVYRIFLYALIRPLVEESWE